MPEEKRDELKKTFQKLDTDADGYDCIRAKRNIEKKIKRVSLYMTVYECNPTNIIIIVFKKSKLLNNLNYFINNFKLLSLKAFNVSANKIPTSTADVSSARTFPQTGENFSYNLTISILV